jgi:hypothetical protein
MERLDDNESHEQGAARRLAGWHDVHYVTLNALTRCAVARPSFQVSARRLGINGWRRRSRAQENGESGGAGAITPLAMRMLASSNGALDTRGSATRLPSMM